MAQDGFLIIADISGYSKYLHESELDHARDSLSDLLDVLVEHTRSPLRIVELEGDAVFSYAPAEEVRSAGRLTGMVEDAYVAFRRALNLMVINTTCTCKACRLLPTLDLKFFIHYGSYARQDVRQHQKLVGNDVNLIHRLLKNSVAETTGFEAYAAYTEAAVEQLALDRTMEGFVAHSESYDDVGEVPLCVQDMHGLWEQRKDAQRVRVSEDEVLLREEYEFSVPPVELWGYVTEPTTRNLLIQSDKQHLERRPDGSTGPGATYVCAHGSMEVLQTIVDWDPPRSYTVRSKYPPPHTVCLFTIDIEPSENGSRMLVLWGRAKGPWLYRPIGNLMAKTIGLRNLHKGIQALRERVQQDLQRGERGSG